MNKTDKETLLDIYQSIQDLVKEAEVLLSLEAPKFIFDRAASGWISDMKRALGQHKYVESYYSTFWKTLERLGILNKDGQVNDIKDDDDGEDEASSNMTNEGGNCTKVIRWPHNPSLIKAISSLDKDNEENDNENEGFIETIYALDAGQTIISTVQDKDRKVVEKPVEQFEVKQTDIIEKERPKMDIAMVLGGVWNYE